MDKISLGILMRLRYDRFAELNLRSILSLAVCAGYLLFYTSCSKKWDETCDTSVYFELAGTGGSTCAVSRFEVNISDFAISGKRMQGEGFSVDSKSLQANSNLLLNTESAVLFTTFEQRQGTYTNMDFEFTFDKLGDTPALQIEAVYDLTNEEEGESDTTYLHISLNSKSIIRKTMYDISKNLVAGSNYGIYLSVDLNYLLGGITATMIEEAATDDDELIIVDENTNSTIYNAVYERTLSSFTVRF